MSRDCVPLEELEAVLAGDADDPRRRHLASCPRCRARLREYRDFVSAEDVPPGADPAAAARALDAALQRDLATSPGASRSRGETTPFPRTGRAAGAAPAGKGGPFGFASPARALAAGLALVLVAGASAVFLLQDGEPPPEILRSADTPAESWQLRVETGSPSQEETPALRLSWKPQPDADAYEIRIHAADLRRLGRFGPLTDTEGVVPMADLGERPEPGTPLLVRVIALADGDETARSPLITVAAP